MRDGFATSWISIDAGTPTRGRRIATGVPSGHWASARRAMASGRGGNGPRFCSPRAWSFTLLGLDAYCAAVAQDADARRLRVLLANRLLAILAAVETQD